LEFGKEHHVPKVRRQGSSALCTRAIRVILPHDAEILRGPQGRRFGAAKLVAVPPLLLAHNSPAFPSMGNFPIALVVLFVFLLGPALLTVGTLTWRKRRGLWPW